MSSCDCPLLPLTIVAGVGWIQGTIPVQPVTTAESHPSRRFRELLRAKIAAEQQRPPEPREPLALNITQYALDLATHKAGDTVFNPSFAGKHYSTAPEPQKLGPYNMNGGPSFRAPSFSQSRETRAYTPTSYPGDDTFTSTTQDSFNTLAFTGMSVRPFIIGMDRSPCFMDDLLTNLQAPS